MTRKSVSFVVQIPSEIVEELEMRFLEPAESLLKGKVSEMLEEYTWELDEGDTEAFDSVSVREVKAPLKLLLTLLRKLLLDAALGREIKERVMERLIDMHTFEKRMHRKAQEYISSYAHGGNKALLAKETDLDSDPEPKTGFDR